jgi:hypothetical protein
LQERFDLSLSISQINRVRAALGISNHPKAASSGKKKASPTVVDNHRAAKPGLIREKRRSLLEVHQKRI